MILVDTSVLIDYLKGTVNNAIDKFNYILSIGIPFGINQYIYQELLQGAASEEDYFTLKKYLDTQNFYSLKKGLKSYSDAAMIYLKCRQVGYTIRSTVDCLIVQTALENDVSLLHNDKDFDMIQTVIVQLKIY